MIYLFYGEEKYELYRELEKIKNEFSNLEVGVNYYNITKENIDELEALYDSVNFFGDNKLVVIKDTGIKFDTKKMISEHDKDDVYVIIEDAVDKRLSSFKDLSKDATVKEFKYLNENEMANYIIQALKKYNIEMPKSVADYMVSVCGIDKSNNINELKKIVAYTKENSKVTKEIIDKVCSKTLNSKVFDMLDAAVSKKHEKAIEMFRGTYKTKRTCYKDCYNAIQTSKTDVYDKICRFKDGYKLCVKTSSFCFFKTKKGI